jgi:hypothetical protein
MEVRQMAETKKDPEAPRQPAVTPGGGQTDREKRQTETPAKTSTDVFPPGKPSGGGQG